MSHLKAHAIAQAMRAARPVGMEATEEDYGDEPVDVEVLAENLEKMDSGAGTFGVGSAYALHYGDVY